MRFIPNIISIFRILLVPPVALALLEMRYGLALGLFLLAGISDGLDGYLARRYDWTTTLGAMLDPVGDKLLMVTSFLVLGWLGDLPWWLVILVILRDVVIVTGAVFYRFLIGEVIFDPLLISKINTVCQILLVTVTLALLAGIELFAPWQPILMYVVAATTLISGISYVTLWSKRAMEKSAAKQQ